MKIHLAKFKEADFPEYKSWYKDADLNLRLGPMDDEWLEHVTKATDGSQYSFFRDEELIAVVGIKFPNNQYPAYYITDFAMKPGLRGQGIGTEVLSELIKQHVLEPDQTWRAFIDVKNPKAKIFFEKNGWACTTNEPDEHGMFMLELKK
ncbi:GNAT family N-acetyltransferase [Candidatus Peregrinibacteria bacterium]|nr:GNAT family N-acetyltransferase [Candidatus Peregrinibacteria bacterium]